MNLKIQCPNCSKRFTAHEDLMGKTVECGSCNHRFPVTSETIIIEKAKVYPGEHRSDDFLNRLGRSPGGAARKPAPQAPPAEEVPKVDAIMPASPGRNMAAGAGFFVILFYLLIFLIGTTENGIFQDVGIIRRIVLTSFVGLLSLGMIIYGAKNWRFQATMAALTLVAILAALTWIRPVRMTPTVADDAVVTPPKRELPVRRLETNDDDLRERVGYEAVERKLRRLGEEFGAAAPNHLLAIFVEDLKPGQFFKLEKYFMRVLRIPPAEGINRYERGAEKRDSLIVISGFPIDFEEAVRLCDPRLGRATTHPELRLIELKLSAMHDTNLDANPASASGSPGERSFFASNYKDLSALNPDVVTSAVKNLAGVPDDLELKYQEEVVLEFMRLLGSESEKDLLVDLGKGFRRWAGDNRAAQAVVANKIADWIKNGDKVHSDYLEYLIENKEPRALVFVDELWSAEPEFWSRQYALIGPVAEPRLIEHLESSPLRLRKAAATILGKIGSRQAVPALEKYREASDDELRIIVERAIKAIQER